MTYIQKCYNYSKAAAERKNLMEIRVIWHEDSTVKTADNKKSKYYFLKQFNCSKASINYLHKQILEYFPQV